jgi:hypothetical protein
MKVYMELRIRFKRLDQLKPLEKVFFRKTGQIHQSLGEEKSGW